MADHPSAYLKLRWEFLKLICVWSIVISTPYITKEKGIEKICVITKNIYGYNMSWIVLIQNSRLTVLIVMGLWTK